MHVGAMPLCCGQGSLTFDGPVLELRGLGIKLFQSEDLQIEAFRVQGSVALPAGN